MRGTPYDALVAYILSVDTSIVSYLLPINALFAVAIVAAVSRQRRPLELVTLFLLAFLGALACSMLLFHVGLDRPFFRLEIVDYP